MTEKEKRQRGAVTDYRPDDDHISGGSDHSVQTEARGAEGSEDLANDSATSGGAAGRTDTFDDDTRRSRAEKSKT